MDEKEQPMFCDYDDELPCCYPIEDCENCPAHPDNEDFYRRLTTVAVM